MNHDDTRKAIEARLNDEHSDLATDLDRSIEVLFREIDLGSSGPGPIGLDPATAMSLLRPMIRTKADEDPDAVMRALAVIHLETGALLEHHLPDDSGPVDLV